MHWNLHLNKRKNQPTQPLYSTQFRPCSHVVKILFHYLCVCHDQSEAALQSGQSRSRPKHCPRSNPIRLRAKLRATMSPQVDSEWLTRHNADCMDFSSWKCSGVWTCRRCFQAWGHCRRSLDLWKKPCDLLNCQLPSRNFKAAPDVCTHYVWPELAKRHGPKETLLLPSVKTSKLSQLLDIGLHFLCRTRTLSRLPSLPFPVIREQAKRHGRHPAWHWIMACLAVLAICGFGNLRCCITICCCAFCFWR